MSPSCTPRKLFFSERYLMPSRVAINPEGPFDRSYPIPLQMLLKEENLYNSMRPSWKHTGVSFSAGNLWMSRRVKIHSIRCRTHPKYQDSLRLLSRKSICWNKTPQMMKIQPETTKSTWRTGAGSNPWKILIHIKMNWQVKVRKSGSCKQ